MRRIFRSAALAFVATLAFVSIASDVAFGRQDCITGFNPPALEIPASGTPSSFGILTATPTCAWLFDGSPLPTWLNFPSIFGGQGPTTVSFPNVVPNHDQPARSTVARFDNRAITISQAANPCPLTFSAPTPATIPANGGTGSFTVNTTGSSCTYAVSPTEGVTIETGENGSTFPATVTYTVAANTTSQPVNRAVFVSSLGTFFFAPGVGIPQNGPPIATDAPSGGYAFAVRRGSGSPHVTSPEPLRITDTENPTAAWTAASTQAWLVVSPTSGTSPATAQISIDADATAGLGLGSHGGFVTVTSSVAPSTPTRVPITLTITDAGSSTFSPSGVLDVPLQNAMGLNGAVPVGGWAVDDIGIRRVQIFRSSTAGEPVGEIYLGDATRVRGARPDIVAALTLPEVTRAGWGFMILSNVLPNGGNGTFDLLAYAEDIEGRRTRLGRKTVTFDNTSSGFPFGTIDVPTQGGAVSGTAAAIQGWVLAQPGRTIPFDGSTIRLLIDGALQPHAAVYGLPRPDVASFFPFPTYTNANGAGAQFVIDTTQFADGLHTVAWQAIDDIGVAQGIGSRYFSINNGAGSLVTEPPAAEARSAAAVRALPQTTAFVWNRHGFDERSWSLQFAGGRTNEIRQAPGERLEVALDTWWWSKGCGPYTGYLMTGDVAGPLPPGASIDGDKGVFSWLPPVEFGGTFELVFVRQACSGREERIPLRVNIAPR
jgi:hypothetical protein